MKSFAVVAIVLAVAVAVSNAHYGHGGVAGILSPTLRGASGLTDGVASGLISAAPLVGQATQQVGSALSNVADGGADIAQGTLAGLGCTVDNLPATLEGLLNGLNGGLLGSLLGGGGLL